MPSQFHVNYMSNGIEVIHGHLQSLLDIDTCVEGCGTNVVILGQEIPTASYIWAG